MELLIESEAPPLKHWDDGSIRVGGTRLLLEIVIYAYNSGQSAEEITHYYPPIKLADVHSVIAYYLRHRNQVDEYVAEVERDAKRIHAEIEAKFPTTGLRERLLARQKAMQQAMQETP